MAKRESHGLGVGHGSLIENGDGTVSYRRTGTLMDAFRVRISEVTGFSDSKNPKALERILTIFGNGTELASVHVNYGTPAKIEAWFRAHPDFHGAQAVRGEPAPAASLADELLKLAQLRDAGVLTDDEFATQKARLLAGG